MFRLGTRAAKPLMSEPSDRIVATWLPLSRLTETGTSLLRCGRRCAVTMTSSGPAARGGAFLATGTVPVAGSCAADEVGCKNVAADTISTIFQADGTDNALLALPTTTPST